MNRPPNCPDRTCGECFRCHIASVSISPAAMPTRHNDRPSRSFNNNSWERGVAVHKPSGMPYLDERLDTIPLHEWQSKRSTYEAKLNAQTTAASSSASTIS